MRTIQTAAHPRGPLGATITIDRIPWVPKASRSGSRTGHQAINVAEVHIDEHRVRNWPMVYILTNAKEAYVGQTTSILNRMDQHGANPEKQDFTHTNLIYSDAFNMSVITDYEHRLIQLINADGLYRLTNKNEGMQDSDYCSSNSGQNSLTTTWFNIPLSSSRSRRSSNTRPISDSMRSKRLRSQTYSMRLHLT